jgi:hypothetical protein
LVLEVVDQAGLFAVFLREDAAEFEDGRVQGDATVALEDGADGVAAGLLGVHDSIVILEDAAVTYRMWSRRSRSPPTQSRVPFGVLSDIFVAIFMQEARQVIWMK